MQRSGRQPFLTTDYMGNFHQMVVHKTGEVSSGYRESGYLPEAVINFLALLGWNPGNDQELIDVYKRQLSN